MPMWYFLVNPMRPPISCVHTVYESSAVTSRKTTSNRNCVWWKFKLFLKKFLDIMSLNTAHANNGVLIHAGEYILLHSDSVSMEFSGQDNPLFKGSKTGRIYLTSHRMIFNSKKSSDPLQSFSAPFVALSDVEIEQPVFGANYIKGKVRAQPNGNYVGEVKFKLHFKAGGAIEYGQALLRAAKTAMNNYHRGGLPGDDPPPYAPAGAWHEAPPPAYQPPPGYYGWLPQHDAFSGPAPNTVFISDNPPPYPGITPPTNQPAPQPQQQPTEPTWYGFSVPPQNPQPQQQPGYGPQGWNGGYVQPPPYAACSPNCPPGAPYAMPPAAGAQAPYGGYNSPGGFNTPGYMQPQQPNGYPGGGPPQQQPQQPPAAGLATGAAGGTAAASFMGFSLPPGISAQ
ncbi:WW domain-binding protein 2 isoform X2 [Scaptodrosophila lebanonensis]|uniref:WW domain-binding protein 2 isoform X2 n=1 Tax=Drosophila lebanonensis TaxID=7225 RepID=A0A6J2TAG0_DROLE|nr:WW domain-binding protein 2 isoform X2 [Scaptodrosophila lebanonensis]